MIEQKVIEQNLSRWTGGVSSDEEATKLAQWTWKEGEIAYIADNSAFAYSYYIVKVRFTGKRWISPQREKIYEYEVLDSTSSYHLQKKNKGEVSWDSENDFYTTLEGAMEKIAFWRERKDKSLEEEKIKNATELELFYKKLTENFSTE